MVGPFIMRVQSVIFSEILSATLCSADGVAAGAAILNGGTIDNIIGDFVGNHTDAYGGAIDNVYSGKISNITGNFVRKFCF